MSNAFDKASLVMLPHAYEEGKLYSLKPTDRSGDFTFSRGADTATRVGEDGYIKKEHSNLLLQSNTFDSSGDWVNERLNISTGHEGYDGSSDAWKLVPDAANSTHRINQSTSLTGVKTFSIYAKAAGYDYIRIMGFAGNTISWTFDLASGSTISAPNTSYTVDYGFENVGNDWYKLTITSAQQHTNWYVFVYDNIALSNFAGNGTDGIYIQDAQLNQGLVATPYLETTTAPVFGGLTDNMPRLDYTDATCPSLLLEPSRTNLVTYSEYLLDGWTDTGCTITKTNETNPSGNDISYFATAIDSASADRIRYFGGTKNGDYYFSFFAKGDGNAHQIYLRALGGSGASNMYWDVAADGTISFNSNDSSANGSPITEDFGNGWYRIGFKQTFTGSNAYSDIRPSSGDINSGIYIWGVQWEQGSYPTSYIPTYGSAQTRPADDINRLTGVGVDSDEFTIFLEFDLSDTPLVSNLGTYFQTFDASNNSQQEFRFFTWNGEQVLVPYFRQDGAYAFGNGSNAVRFDGKILFRSDGGGSYTMFFGFNGISTKEVRTGLTAYTLNKINFISQPKTNVKQLLIFNEALSDEQCIALTQN